MLAGDNFTDIAEAKSRIGIVGASEHHRNALFLWRFSLQPAHPIFSVVMVRPSRLADFAAHALQSSPDRLMAPLEGSASRPSGRPSGLAAGGCHLLPLVCCNPPLYLSIHPRLQVSNAPTENSVMCQTLTQYNDTTQVLYTQCQRRFHD